MISGLIMRLFLYCYQTEQVRDIIGIEIQKEAVELAKKNIILNKLDNQIEIIHADINEYVKMLQSWVGYL